MSSDRELNDIKAIVFDVFGTIAEIQEPRRPYFALLRHMKSLGHKVDPRDRAVLMARDLDLAATALHFGFALSSEMLGSLQRELFVEIQSIRPFPDALSTFETLRAAGYKVAICSNLAAPYAQPITSLVPFAFDVCTWSFEVGALKPEPKIYDHVCRALECAPHEVLMVGDTLAADYHGPRKFGMRSTHLSRHGGSKVHDSISSLSQIPSLLA